MRPATSRPGIGNPPLKELVVCFYGGCDKRVRGGRSCSAFCVKLQRTFAMLVTGPLNEDR